MYSQSESWKWSHAAYVQEVITTEFDLSDLRPAEVAPFLDRFPKAPAVEIKSQVPAYLLGGRSGGIQWSAFKNYALEDPEEAAEALSLLFDEDEPLAERLRRFNSFCRPLETSGGPMLSLATMFLMFAYPQEYVMYKYGKFRAFFGAYSDYEVTTGYDVDQYWILNEGCRRIRRRLSDEFAADPRIDVDADMLDVHTFIWVTEKYERL